MMIPDPEKKSPKKISVFEPEIKPNKVDYPDAIDISEKQYKYGKRKSNPITISFGDKLREEKERTNQKWSDMIGRDTGKYRLFPNTLTEEIVKSEMYRDGFPEWFNQLGRVREILYKLVNADRRDFELFVQSATSDPFNDVDQVSWDVRYFAGIVFLLYPPSMEIMHLESGDDIEQYSNPFHIRGLFYRIITEKYLIPYWKNGSIEFRMPENDSNIYQHIAKLVGDARYAGIIPFGQVIDARITDKVMPYILGLKKNIKNKVKFKPQIDVDVRFTNLDPVIEAPVILFYSEKGELRWVFERMAQKYRIAYYIGMGQVSITATKDIYDYIQQNSKLGIVLVCSDYDKAGITITYSLARKLQYFALRDKPENRANIIVHPFALNRPLVNKLYGLGLKPYVKYKKQTKEEKDNNIDPEPIDFNLKPILVEGKFVDARYELNAMESLIGKGNFQQASNLFHVFDILFRNVIDIGTDLNKPLLRGAVITQEFIKSKKNAQRRTILNRLKFRDRSGKKMIQNIDNLKEMEDKLEKELKQSDYYKNLDTLTEKTLSLDTYKFITDSEKAIKESEEFFEKPMKITSPDYWKGTRSLQDYKWRNLKQKDGYKKSIFASFPDLMDIYKGIDKTKYTSKGRGEKRISGSKFDKLAKEMSDIAQKDNKGLQLNSKGILNKATIKDYTDSFNWTDKDNLLWTDYEIYLNALNRKLQVYNQIMKDDNLLKQYAKLELEDSKKEIDQLDILTKKENNIIVENGIVIVKMGDVIMKKD